MHISIHAPRTGSDVNYYADLLATSVISIHAPRTGSDILLQRADAELEQISIHAPRTGSDGGRIPTLYAPKHFNPRSPHGERQADADAAILQLHISIHAPRTGSDTCERRYPIDHNTFQSTLPARGATRRTRPQSCRPRPFQSTLPARGATDPADVRAFIRAISIHAPRTGSDARVRDAHTRAVVISIHAPRTGSDGYADVD